MTTLALLSSYCAERVDWEEVWIKTLPIIAAGMILLILIPHACWYWQEWHAFDRLIATRETFSAVQRAYRERMFRELPAPAQRGEKIRVDVHGVILYGVPTQ